MIVIYNILVFTFLPNCPVHQGPSIIIDVQQYTTQLWIFVLFLEVRLIALANTFTVCVGVVLLSDATCDSSHETWDLPREADSKTQ